MDKTSEKVTKDPKRVEAVRKSREKYMNKLTDSILNDPKKGRDTTNTSNETNSHTTNTSNETSIYTNNASNETTSSINTATTTI